MSPGALLQKARSKFGRGLRVAYWRDIVRPRILRTAPVVGTRDRACEIHVLTSAGDWLNLIWALNSFYHFSGRRYALCIHDDGSLRPQDRGMLRHHFPDARLIERSVADERVFKLLDGYPRCLAFRRSNHLAPKVFDFAAYLESDRMLLLDSDVLFFSEPTELLRRIEDPAYRLNSVNADIATAYTVDPAQASVRLGFPVVERFNSGLGLIHRGSLRFDWVEEFLSLPGILGHFWRIEQTIYALCSSKWGVELLPLEYGVRLDGVVEESPCRHYVGAIRHLMFKHGLRTLVKEGFLRTHENLEVCAIAQTSD